MWKQGYTDLVILDINPGGIVVIFFKKAGKNLEIISKINNLKKRKKPRGGSKYDKLCIKNGNLHFRLQSQVANTGCNYVKYYKC